MAIKFDLIMLYKCYRHENTSKESKEYIFENFSCVRPLPADSGHQSDRKNHENHQKIEKIAIFQKSIFCCIVAGNMIFGRKSALWTPESPQKAYIDHPTWYGYILKKVKKIAFFTSKISIKNFSGRIFWPMWPGQQINIGGQYILFPPPNPYNLEVYTPPLPTCMHHQKFQNFPKNRLFSRKCCFCCFLGVANVV